MIQASADSKCFSWTFTISVTWESSRNSFSTLTLHINQNSDLKPQNCFNKPLGNRRRIFCTHMNDCLAIEMQSQFTSQYMHFKDGSRRLVFAALVDSPQNCVSNCCLPGIDTHTVLQRVGRNHLEYSKVGNWLALQPKHPSSFPKLSSVWRIMSSDAVNVEFKPHPPDPLIMLF